MVSVVVDSVGSRLLCERATTMYNVDELACIAVAFLVKRVHEANPFAAG